MVAARADEEFGVWGLAAPAPAIPTLEGSLDAEIVIVGAGYTGLSTALHLAQRGLNCVVVEGREPGWGASGRNTGWLEPNWWLKRPSDIAKLFGAELGAELTRWVASGPQLLARWCERYGLEIELDRRGLLMATDVPAKAQALEAEAAEWQAAGIRYDFLDGVGVSAHIATNRYRGGLLLHDGCVLNPLALSRELARACLQSGVRIFGHTPVTSISREGSRWSLHTARGTVHGRRLVLATDAYTGKLWPALEKAYATWRLGVIASEPYEPLKQLLPLGTAVADLALGNVFTLRSAGGGRLVTSIFAPVGSSMSPARFAEPFMRKFRRVFPSAPQPRWQYAHQGDVGLSRDMMPRLCAIGPQAWTAYGYSGTGINLSLLMGGQLAALAETDDPKSALFPVTALEPLALRGLIGWGLRYLHAPLSRGLISRFA
jgi:glycine/D-amino acid oxidase-like deaminating enzyme